VRERERGVRRHPAEDDVDQTVGGTDSTLDPDRKWREEDGDEPEANVTSTHVCELVDCVCWCGCECVVGRL
jgi:hypothetical protein